MNISNILAGDVDDLTSSTREALVTAVAALQKLANAAFERVIARHNIEVAKLVKYVEVSAN